MIAPPEESSSLSKDRPGCLALENARRRVRLPGRGGASVSHFSLVSRLKMASLKMYRRSGPLTLGYPAPKGYLPGGNLLLRGIQAAMLDMRFTGLP
jgi:hypothetical protein